MSIAPSPTSARTRARTRTVAPAFAGAGAPSALGTSTTDGVTTVGSASSGPVGETQTDADAERAAAPGRLRGGSRRSPRRNGRTNLTATLVAVLLGLLVAVGGLALVDQQQARYSATASLLVVPESQPSAGTAASLYDSLSTGQVVESYRAVMASPGFTTAVLDSQALAPGERYGIAVDVHVVPSTALVDVTVTADSPKVAERVADALAVRATGELPRTFSPYQITAVSPAAGTAERAGPSARTMMAVVILLALVLGVVVQQAMLFVARSRERASDRSASTASGYTMLPAPVGDR